MLERSLSGETSRALLTDARGASPLRLRPDDPVVVNAGGWGFFRTRYEPSLFAALIQRLSSLDALERFNLVSDTWASVYAGVDPVGEFLDLVELLGASPDGSIGERNPSVWEAAIDGLGTCYRALPDPSSFAAWERGLLGSVFGQLGWAPEPGESESVARLRGVLVQALGTTGEDPDVQAHARALHDAGTAPADLLTPIVTVIAWTGTPAEYELFWDRIRNAATPQDEVRYLFRLPLFPSEELLLRTLDATLDEIRAQNGAFTIAFSLSNRVAGRAAWAWLTDHWDDVLKRLPDNSRGRMLEGIVRLTDADMLEATSSFLADHPLPTARLQVAQLLERQRVNATFVGAAGQVLAQRFRQGALPLGLPAVRPSGC